jgi:hypothetical protein
VSSIYQPSKWQQEVHACRADYILGAGSAGVGKSRCLIGDVLPQVFSEHQRCMDKHHPHRMGWGKSSGWALYLRRELTELEQTMVHAQRVYEAIDPNGEWSSKTNTFLFSSGYRVQFGHCQHSDDHLKYLSREFSWVGLDEAVTFEKKQAQGIFSRVRSSDPVLRTMLRRMMMSNPGMSPGADPHWLRRMYVDPHPQGRRMLYRKLRMGDGEAREITRMYIPGRLSDNPDKQFAADYELSLRELPEAMRAAYLDGNWYHVAGAHYANEWDPHIHVVRGYKVPRDWPKFRSMDWGFKSPGCVLWWAIDEDENLVCFDEFNFKETVDVDVASRIRDIELRHGLWDEKAKRSRITGPADTQIWEERGNSAERIIDVFARNGILWEQADKSPGSRRAHAERILKRLKSHFGRTQLPGIMFFESCTKCITTLPQIPSDEAKPDEPKKGGDDHAHDAIAYGVAYATRGAKGISMGATEDTDEWGDWAARDNVQHESRWGLGSGYR